MTGEAAAARGAVQRAVERAVQLAMQAALQGIRARHLHDGKLLREQQDYALMLVLPLADEYARHFDAPEAGP